MPEYVLGKVHDALKMRGKALKGSQVLVLGIAYKKNVDDMRESPSIELVERLLQKGAVVAYSDPHVQVSPKLCDHFIGLRCDELTAESLRKYDCVLIGTNHDCFDWDLIRINAALIVDTRGVYRGNFDHIVRS
jgi:UDP-N-acetyl-D-glucosamine dehydrogenase